MTCRTLYFDAFLQFQWNEDTLTKIEDPYEHFSTTPIIRESSNSCQYSNEPVLTPCFDLILAGRKLSKVRK